MELMDSYQNVLLACRLYYSKEEIESNHNSPKHFTESMYLPYDKYIGVHMSFFVVFY